MHWPPDASDDIDPRHVFLDARDAMACYGWGRTKGWPKAALEAPLAPDRQETTVTDLLPQPKRRQRTA